MKATSEKPSKKPRLMDNSRELANIISHDDYGFAPIKKEILRHENVTTIRNIMSRWKAMESKAKEMKQGVVRLSYGYLACLGKYIEALVQTGIDPDVISIFYEHDNFHYDYLRYLTAALGETDTKSLK